MNDKAQRRTPYYLVAQELCELRSEIEKLKCGRVRDRADIATLIKHNRSLRSTITRLEKRLTGEPRGTVRRPQARSTPDPNRPRSESDVGSSGVPDFSESLSELSSAHRVHS